MRDVILLSFFFMLLPWAFLRPIVGALLFAGVSLMNPHRLSYGIAYDMPLAQIAAAVTLVGLLFARNVRYSRAISAYSLVLVYVVWMGVTTVFAIDQKSAIERYDPILKSHLMLVVTLALMVHRKQVEALVWIVVLAIGFYGVKGGIFTILGGAEDRVWGPTSSVIAENNALAVAVLMMVPILLALRGWLPVRWGRWAQLGNWGLAGAAALCVLSSLGSYSRGGLLACLAMLGTVWIKSDKKVMVASTVIAAGLLVALLLPDKWWDRMDTISEYEQDGSAMGRINTWKTAINVANDRVTGAGFEYYGPDAFQRYAPNPEAIHSAHSIYFQALGEHGWIGLLLYLSFWFFVWARCSAVRRRAARSQDWAHWVPVLDAFKSALVAFGVGGAFLNIGNWDGVYYLAVVVLAADALTQAERAEVSTTKRRTGRVPSGT